MGSFGEKTFRARISILGEFADRELEKEFAGQEMIHSKKFGSFRSAAAGGAVFRIGCCGFFPDRR
ncbi:MAG: hypothetical protein ACOX3Y_02200 [Clostridia bacterium]